MRTYSLSKTMSFLSINNFRPLSTFLYRKSIFFFHNLVKGSRCTSEADRRLFNLFQQSSDCWQFSSLIKLYYFPTNTVLMKFIQGIHYRRFLRPWGWRFYQTMICVVSLSCRWRQWIFLLHLQFCL